MLGLHSNVSTNEAPSDIVYSPEKCFGLCNTKGYHPGPVAPPCGDGPHYYDAHQLID